MLLEKEVNVSDTACLMRRISYTELIQALFSTLPAKVLWRR